MTYLKPFAIGAFALVGSTAQAATFDALDLLQSFNTIALGNLTASSETEGTVYVGGDFASNGYTVNPDGLADGTVGTVSGSLIVGGDVSGNPINLNNGSAQIGGTATAIINNNGNGVVQTGVADIPVNDVAAALSGLSASLGALDTTAGASADFSDQNGTRINSGTGDNGVAILNLTEAESISFLRNGANGGFAGIDSSLTTIINLYGTDLRYSSNFNVDNENVLLNFVDTTSLTIQGGALGFSILAPLADISATGGGVNGTVVGNNIEQRIEFRPFDNTNVFDGQVPTIDSAPEPSPEPVPLPAAAWMLLSALAGLGWMRRRSA